VLRRLPLGLILTCLYPGTKSDYFRQKPPTNERCVLLSEYPRFMGLTQTSLVAITRAQALLIVLGDPEVLGKDELWRTFLEA